MFKKVCNISENERIVRMGLGLVLLFVATSYTDGLLRVTILVLAVVGLVTGIFNYDPVYDLLNISSAKRSQSSKRSKRSKKRR